MTSSTYAAITKEVQRLVADAPGNDKTMAAYMVARAALVFVANTRGYEHAAEKAFALGDELATGGTR